MALAQGQRYSAVARHQQVRCSTVSEWAKNVAATGLAVLVDQPRSGRPLVIQGPERAKRTAFACSAAPNGRSQ